MKQHNIFSASGNQERILTIATCFILMLLNCVPVVAQQQRYLPLQQAISMGLANSKTLKISKAKVTEAIERYKQAENGVLPEAKLSFGLSEGFIPNNTLQLSDSMKIRLPKTTSFYLSTLSINEPIFAGHKLRYAKQSAQLLEDIAALDTINNKNQIAFDIINAYYNLLEVTENQKIVAQNATAIQQQLSETQKFEQQGLATKNDVLRWQLQLANVQLTGIGLENNRKIINYDLNIMLGLPDSTALLTDSTISAPAVTAPGDYINQALSQRQDLAEYNYRLQLNDVNIRKIQSSKYPTLGAGISAYYINPSANPFPPKNTYLTVATIGLNLGWNIASLYTSKHKASEAQVQKEETALAQSNLQDNIKMEIQRDYQNYKRAESKITVLQQAVEQATENDRIMESKYQNQLANTTDRIDAETLLYQAKINLQLSKIDALIAYYTLLTATGNIQL